MSSKPSTSASADDTSRRTWDRAAYAQKAADREATIKEEGRARAEAKAAGKKYHARAPSPSSLHDSTSRAARLDVAANVGKTTLVPSGAAVGKRGRGAGFYCEACDLTFKDNLQLVEHLNKRQHLINSGQSGEVRKATLQEVKDRLEWLREKRREEEKEKEGLGEGLRERLERRGEDDEKEREEKRRKRREKRREMRAGAGGGGGGIKVEDEDGYGGGIIC